jgi:hypothetical protein
VGSGRHGVELERAVSCGDGCLTRVLDAHRDLLERRAVIPGMILAPVILHYIKVETSKIRVHDVPEQLSESGGPDIAVGK